MTGHTGHHMTALYKPADTSWHTEANCLGEDVNVFFAPEGERIPQREAREAKAKSICADCPAIQLCRDEALARNDTWGVRGGLTPEELKAERRRRQRRGELPAADACVHGHPKTAENTHRDSRGNRRCKPCWQSGYRLKNKRRAAA